MTYRYSDHLRGLLDRDAFIRMLSVFSSGASSAERMVALIVEIDQPSRANHRLGDPSGDTLMRLVLGRTQSVLPTECLAARIRQNAVALLLFVPISEEAVEALCTDLHASIRTPLTGGGCQIYLSASVGVAFTAPKVSPVAAMQLAEGALDRVIANGGDATFVHRPDSLQSLNMEIAA
jgi:GGDEF domain-containing protein